MACVCPMPPVHTCACTHVLHACRCSSTCGAPACVGTGVHAWHVPPRLPWAPVRHGPIAWVSACAHLAHVWAHTQHSLTRACACVHPHLMPATCVHVLQACLHTGACWFAHTCSLAHAVAIPIPAPADAWALLPPLPAVAVVTNGLKLGGGMGLPGYFLYIYV